MKTTYVSYIFTLLLLNILAGSVIAAPQKDQNQEDFKAFLNANNKDFNNYQEQEQKAWQQYKKEVEEKWGKFLGATREQWVDYNKNDKESRIKVNFKEGYLEVEAVVAPKTGNESDISNQLLDKILEQLKTTYQEKENQVIEAISDVIINKKGEKVSNTNIKPFIEEEVKPRIKIEKEEVAGKDGQKRIKATYRKEMLPNYVQKLAGKYMHLVDKYTAEYGVYPPLVYGIIYCESYFNPRAVSSTGAVGLMQLMPQYGAKDAYRFITNGQDKDFKRAELYDPNLNIQLGTAYLKVLKEKDFPMVTNLEKRRFLMICGYNWGPHRIKKKILPKYDINGLSNREVYNILRKRTPKETQGYLKRVTEKMHEIFEPMYQK